MKTASDKEAEQQTQKHSAISTSSSAVALFCCLVTICHHFLSSWPYRKFGIPTSKWFLNRQWCLWWLLTSGSQSPCVCLLFLESSTDSEIQSIVRRRLVGSLHHVPCFLNSWSSFLKYSFWCLRTFCISTHGSVVALLTLFHVSRLVHSARGLFPLLCVESSKHSAFQPMVRRWLWWLSSARQFLYSPYVYSIAVKVQYFCRTRETWFHSYFFGVK